MWGSVFPQCILVPGDPQASTRTRRPHDVDHLLPLLHGLVLKPRCPSELSRVDRGPSGRPDWSAAPYPTHWDALSIRTRLGSFSRWSYRSSPVAFGPPPSPEPPQVPRSRPALQLICQPASSYLTFLPILGSVWMLCRVFPICSVLAGSIEAFQVENTWIVWQVWCRCAIKLLQGINGD